MNDDLQDLMREATRLTQAGRLNEATEAIQRILRGETAADAAPLDAAPAWASADGIHVPGGATPQASPLVLDGCVFEVDARKPAATASGTGTFTSGTHTHAPLTRRFKLYTPPDAVGRLAPGALSAASGARRPRASARRPAGR